jgi:hypothetical protein
MTTQEQELLKLAGELATAARNVVGGEDLNGINIRPATVRDIGEKCKDLSVALDRYDRAILRAALTTA